MYDDDNKQLDTPKVVKANEYKREYGDRYFKDPYEQSYTAYNPYDDSRYKYDRQEPLQVPPKQDINFDKKPKATHNWVYAVISIFCIAIISASIVFIIPQLYGIVWTGLDSFAFVNSNIIKYNPENINELKRYKLYMERETIFPGVYIDNTHVGEMTCEGAEALLYKNSQAEQKTFCVTISIGNKDWTINNSNVEVLRDIGNVIQQAYAVGRTNTSTILNTGITPLEQRFEDVVQLRQNGKVFYTSWHYDKIAVKDICDEIAKYVNREPIDSQIESFDFITREFKFTDDQPGVWVDSTDLYNNVCEKIDTWSKNAVVSVEPEIIVAKFTKVDMINNFKRISAFTTKTTKDKDRNNNIDLACRAINGTALLPGQSFSFNKVVGQRTTDKGYKEAGAISKGQSIQDTGGGVCQVSTTLFNAIARADIEISNRKNHAWPISYVALGEDAAVNWPNLDLVFKNNKESPIFIVMYFGDQKTSAEIYGMTLGEGVNIELESKLIRKTEPDPNALYLLNSSLPIGTQTETVKARAGYEVNTYKVWLKNGKEFKREDFYKTNYKPYQKTIEYNDGTVSPANP